MATRGNFKSELAIALGDARVDGSPVYTQGSAFKWAEPAYNAAINFAVEMTREMFMIPMTATSPAWADGASLADIVPPATMVYVNDLVQEIVVSGGLYERVIPKRWITINRNTSGSPIIHLDTTEAKRHGILASARVLFRGYKYQTLPTGDGSTISIPNAALLPYAKTWMMGAVSSRDPGDLLRSGRGEQIAMQQAKIFVEDNLATFPEDGGLWLVENDY